jgi:hypothetical protein
VVAYNATFEKKCIEQMAAAFPALTSQLLSIAARLVDLLPSVRNHVYHPTFDGSFSLKKVLPALVPELSYDGLPISEGATASLELEGLMFSGDEFGPDEKDAAAKRLTKVLSPGYLGFGEASGQS